MLALHRVPRPQLHPRSQAHLASVLGLENGETHFLSTCNWRTVREFDRRAAADKAITDKLEQSTVRLRQSNRRLRQILRSYEPSSSSKLSTKQFLHNVIQELSDSRNAGDLQP